MAAGTVHEGDTLVLEDGHWTVIGIQGTSLVLRCGNATKSLWLHELRSSVDVRILPGGQNVDRPQMPDLDAVMSLDLVAPAEIERARRRLGHVHQVLTGWSGGKPGEGVLWDQWDPDRKTSALDRVKLVELEREPDLGIGSLKTLRKYRIAVERGDVLMGLVDSRFKPKAGAFGRVAPEIVDTLRSMYEADASNSKQNDSDYFLDLPDELAARYPDRFAEGSLVIPSTPTLYRVMKKIRLGRSLLFSQKARRSETNRPVPVSDSILHALRPGHKVLLDTTKLDVLAYENGKSVSVELTIAVDWYSRTILAWTIHKVGAKDVDIGMLLGKVLTPEPMRPSWRENRRIAYSRIPLDRELSLDDWFAKSAEHPVVWPETLLIDRGRSYLNKAALERCAEFGINLQPSRPYTPTDKAIVESTFNAIRQNFCHHVAGYKGSNVLMRGKDVKGFWSMTQLEEFFAEWVLTYWQVHQHDGLRSEFDEALMMTPNEKYAEGVAAAGYLPVFATGDLYVLMLPCKWVQITDKGLQIENLYYRNAATRQLRGIASPVGHRKQKWPVRWDSRDRSRVWLIDYRQEDHNVIEVEWIGNRVYSQPFSDTRMREARRIARARKNGATPTDIEVAQVLRELRRRAKPKNAAERAEEERRDLSDQMQTTSSLAERDRLADAEAKPGHLTLVGNDPEAIDAEAAEVEAGIQALPKFDRSTTARRRKPTNPETIESA